MTAPPARSVGRVRKERRGWMGGALAIGGWGGQGAVPQLMPRLQSSFLAVLFRSEGIAPKPGGYSPAWVANIIPNSNQP